jgi:NitT/TauT family transport system permease protein
MSSTRLKAKDKVQWLAIRRDLDMQRQAVLTFLSFILPVAIWCMVSYVPGIWHPDVRLVITAEREGSATVYTPGDHISKDRFPQFVESIRRENEAALAGGSGAFAPPARQVRRQNQRIVRQIGEFAYINGWVTRADRREDAALYEVWRLIAEEGIEGRRLRLTSENREIVHANWEKIGGMEAFEASLLPDIPLLQLLPQGVAANPVFLPAPHEVLTTGWRLFTEEPEEGRMSMWERLGFSYRIVFTGFLISCLIGMPLGILCGTFNFFSRLLEPFIDFFRYMPAPVFSTLLVAIFGAHDAPKIALIFLGTFFQMVLIVAKTTRLLERSLLEAAQTLGANNRQLLTRVIIPGVLPNLYNDLRILLGWAWTWLVIAELIGVKGGLTEFIETQGRWRNFDQVFPVIFVIGLSGFFTDQILAFLRRYLFPWEPNGRRFGLVGWLMEGREPAVRRAGEQP